MKTPVICTTLLIEKSPQALPLGSACIASAIKHSPETENLTEVALKAFSQEDEKISALKTSAEPVKETARFIADSLYSQAEDICKNAKSDEKKVKFIFCFSCFVWNVTILQETSKLLREKGCICIAGGPEITAHPSFYKGFDFTVSGEGEVTVPHLIKQIIESGEKEKAESQTQ